MSCFACPFHFLREQGCHSLCSHYRLKEHHSCAHSSYVLACLDLMSMIWMIALSWMMCFSSRLRNHLSSCSCRWTTSGTMIGLVGNLEHAEYLFKVSGNVPLPCQLLVVFALVGWGLLLSFSPLLTRFLQILIWLVAKARDYFLVISNPHWSPENMSLMRQNCFLNWFL